MRIAFIEPHLKLFGGIRRIIEMANRLSDRGHDVTIYHSDGSACDWHEVRAKIAPGRAILESEHDAVLYNDPSPEDIYLSRHARAKVTFYYVLGLYRTDLLTGFHPTLYLGRHPRTHLLRKCLRSPHVKLANSSWLQRWLRENMDIDATLLIGGVNTDLFRPVVREGSAGGPFRVLCSGDPRPDRGTDTVREAMHIVREQHPEVSLDEYYGRNIPQEEMAGVYSAADLFVDACRNNGGWNNPVAEAMACRVPVACTRNGQVEDFAFDEKTALLSPKADAQALAINILRMIHTPGLRASIARAGYEHIRTFSWSRSVDRFEEICEAHVGGSR